MKKIFFHGYTINGSAKKEQGRWRPLVRISWASGRQEEKLEGENSFTDQTDAEEYALQMGKDWVINERASGNF
jgi:hypothetical protein